MKIERLSIPEVCLIYPEIYNDNRGFFSEVWNANALSNLGIDITFFQDNHSYSSKAGTLRGLHFQRPPFAQDKLVRCTKGRILDVAVDIRKGSPHFGKWVSAEISAENWTQILVPKGFAHGFITLTDDCEVQYKVSAPYSPNHDANIAWNDPTLSVDWNFSLNEVKLSEKDARAPLLKNTKTGFIYGTQSE